MNESGSRSRAAPEPSFGSGRTSGTPRHHPSLIHPILSKRVCFYKSGDPQFSGLRLVINSRTFKTFDALLDSLSKKVPLPFGVRNITTPRGVHAVRTLDDLEDGKSYICSDTRKVKPVDLALARRKLAPWYHARPASPPRRQAAQQAGRKQESVFARTPKVLSVFRNGDPGVKHSVALRRRTTPTFESVLESISDVLQFHVVKLHTADGRRVDGFPGLILCSGTVVAAGREPFRPANYNAQISPAQSTLPTKRTGPRRLRSLKRKKKSKPHTPKPRNFSLSSERYIVNRIQSSIAGGSDHRPARSVEAESGHTLESVAETPDTGLVVASDERDGRHLPSDDDIEKSFRVNQDGSMTVEMRVRLTIKEEETIHWTTTLARSSVASRLDATCSPEAGAEQEIDWLDSVDRDKTRDDNDEDPPSLGNGVFGESNDEEDGGKVQAAAESPRSPPTSGHERVSKKQASVEAEGVQVGSYSHREPTHSGDATEQCRVVKQASGRPVPKPRRQSSVDASNVAGGDASTFKRIESGGEEVSETVLRVYKHQTCQENFFANLCSRDMSALGIPFCKPATSETRRRPSTASESVSVWRADSTAAAASDSNLPSPGPGALQAAVAQRRFPRPAAGQSGPRQRDAGEDERVSSKPKAIHRRARRLRWQGKKRRENSAVKTFSSAGFIKGIYGSKSKSLKSAAKVKKGPAPKGDGGSRQSGDTVKRVLKDLNVPSALEGTESETVSPEKGRVNVAPIEASQPGGTVERQTSRRREEKKENKSCDVSERMSLPAFNSSSAVTNEYVENWLERACLDPSASSDEDGKKTEALTFVQTENGRCAETEKEKVSTFVAGDKKRSEEPNAPLPQDEPEASVKQRIRSFESKPSSQSTKRAAVEQQRVCSHETTTSTENHLDLAGIHTAQIKPLVCSDVVPPTSDTSTEIRRGIAADDKSSRIQVPFNKEAPLNARSKEPPAPGSSAAGGPMPRLIGQTPHKPPPSVSHASDKAETPSDRAVEMTTSIQPDRALARTPSIKRAPLVSNKSLDRKMSLRKACLEKYTLCSDAASETSASSAPVESVGDNVPPNAIGSAGTRRAGETRRSNGTSDVKSGPSRCTAASPARSTSGERTSRTPGDLSLKDTKTDETHLFSQKEATSPKPLVKSVKRVGSPSPGRKPQTNKSPSEPQDSPKLVSLHNQPPDIGTHQTPNADSSTERKLSRPKSRRRRSPYSQSLDVASSPVRHKTGGRRRHRTRRAASSPDVDPCDESKTADEVSVAKTVPRRFDAVNQPNMKPVLEKICYSIKSIRQIAQNKRPSCLEKSNSLPDFSSHVASTFGSSSQALLAFLSVMTLKEGLDDANVDKLRANDVSCAEALKMIDSLREIASIDDSHELKASLSSLQRSASKQLLQSWRGFQDLGDKRGSRTPGDPAPEAAIGSVSEKVIGEILDSLDVPDRLKEELNCLSNVTINGDDEEPTEKAKTESNSDTETSEFSTEYAVKAGSVTKDTEDKDSLCGQKAKPFNRHAAEEKRLCGSVLFAGDNEPNGVKPNREQRALCLHESISEAGEQQSSGDEGREVEREEMRRRNGGSAEDKEARSARGAEPDVRRTSGASGADSHNAPLSEEEQPGVACRAAGTGSDSSLECESTCDADVDDPSSDEEQPEVEGVRLKVIVEESVLGSEEEEEEHLDTLPDQREQIGKYREEEEEEEDSVSSRREDRDADETYICDTVERAPCHFTEDQDSYTLKDKSSCMKSDILTKIYGLNEDEDSGNDHSSCEEHAETKQPKAEDKPANTSSYEDRESCSSEEDGVHIDGHTEESCTEYHAAPPRSEDTKCEKVLEITSQSVAQRVILLEKQVAVAQKTTGSSAVRRSSQRKAPLGPDEEDSPSESPACQPAPQSSLSFSYDSSGVVTSEPEGHRVRSIREMFLAKTAADVQHGCFPSSKASDARAETSVSGGYQTQTSSEASGSEDDSARTSIAKGFVRRTIERLYGKRDARPDQEAAGRPPSTPKAKKKEHLRAFSPFHMSRAKAMSEFSYFNSTHAADPLGEATRCVAFHAEVGPGASVDSERRFQRDDATIRKSASEPVAMNKAFADSGGEDAKGEEDPPYSLFNTEAEPEDEPPSSFSGKCTYFSLPHASDSDAHPDETSAVGKSAADDSGNPGADAAGEASEDAGGPRAERTGVADFKRKGNKVHPVTEPDGEVVLAQPGKRRGVVSTRVEEPDVLDILYNFCGQNCPIL